jgi:transcriptional regulator with XRE-family HTH domain
MPRGSLKRDEYAPKRLGRKLRMIRKAFNYTQPELCERLGFKNITPPTISEYEHGKRLPPYLVLLKYSRISGVSTDVLIDDKLKIYPNRKPIPKGRLLYFGRKR